MEGRCESDCGRDEEKTGLKRGEDDDVLPILTSDRLTEWLETTLCGAGDPGFDSQAGQIGHSVATAATFLCRPGSKSRR